MSNLEAPKFRKVEAGSYVADLTNYKGHGLRATLDKTHDEAMVQGWVLFVTDAQPSGKPHQLNVRVVHNGLFNTKSMATGWFKDALRFDLIRAVFDDALV